MSWIWAASLTGLFFFFALGAIVGSFLNVVVYRLPRGENLVFPSSACPKCGTNLTWRENLPIIGWIMLGGRCRFCRSKISPEYPLIETLVAVLFGGVFALWFMDPSVFEIGGLIDTANWTPEWAEVNPLRRVWPMLLVVLYLLASLVAITLIDARTFMIPLEIPWLAGLVGLIVHPSLAIYIDANGGLDPRRFVREGQVELIHAWIIPGASGPWLGLAVGGTLGLIASCILLRLKVLPTSFADYEQWEKTAIAEEERLKAEAADTVAIPAPEGESARSILTRTLLLTGPAIALMALGSSLGLRMAEKPMEGMLIGLCVGLLIGIVLRNRHVNAQGEDDGASLDPMWVQYPYARREVLKEILFLTPALALGGLGFWLASPGGPLGATFAEPTLWLYALGGSLLGLLIGGGVVWAVRILGSLAFGKEAMGLGDVHLMAGVGACLGWIDPVLAFFIAPFFGIGWTIASVAISRFAKREGSALPYGPHLAAATVLVLLAKPAIEAILGWIMGEPIDLP
ncbi:MAG: prepilin peptidase [Phycisphaerales bacterium]